jgi:hypothetical protein
VKVEGEALRRQWRRWVSTIASVCALVIALVLMSLADVGPAAIEPVQVNQIASGPAPNHQGAGSGLVPSPPSTAPVEIPEHNPAPAVHATSSTSARLVALGTRGGQTINVDGANTGVTSTTTTTVQAPATKPPATVPGKGGHTAGLGKDKKPKKKPKPKPHKPGKHKSHKKPKHKPGTHGKNKPPKNKPKPHKPTKPTATKPAPKKPGKTAIVPLLPLLLGRRRKRLPRI